ncbi:FAD-dependent oxidoreductase [Enhygromyxa salina]|uniref:FAD-dependent oxidoreductase n=1 Tax=Enhygromyxa salina TaxID=215803 RepID=UPI000D08796B|nr:FAD-dependent monooxygenase [Enhygromyxa salina]
MPRAKAPIVIIGGGIAGLATAAGLIRRGIEVRILDRGWLPWQMGMGFIVLRTGLDALCELFPKVLWGSVGAPVLRAKIMTCDSELLSDTRLDAYAISRGTLMETMLRQLPPGTLVDHATVADFARTSDGRVRAVVCEDGRIFPCSMVIGADGIRSTTRRLLHPQVSLDDVRVREVVSIFDAPHVAELIGTTFYKYYDPDGGFGVGIVHVGGGQVVWFVQHDAARYDWADLSPGMIRWKIWEKVAGWPAPIPALWAMTKFSKSHLWFTRDLYPDYDYARDNVVLVGDAAHPVLSFTSHGATGALEDAVLLPPMLSNAFTDPEREAAAAAFALIRRDMFERIVIEGREILERFLLPLAKQPQGVMVPLVK